MKAIPSALAALTLIAMPVLAGCTATTTPATSPASASPSTSAVAFNDADAMFASMMIPHHEQAIEMSDMILSKEGVDQRVITLAEQIKAAQAPEIATLRGWLSAWNVNESGMSHGGHDGGMMSDGDLAALKAASGAEASRLFLGQMIVHHEGAVTMAQSEVDGGQNPDAIALAREIIAAQTTEIQTMRDLLTAL